MKQNMDELLADQAKHINELLGTPTDAWNGNIPCAGNFHIEYDDSPKLVQNIKDGGYLVICDATSTKALSKMIDAFISGITAAHSNLLTKL